VFGCVVGFFLGSIVLGIVLAYVFMHNTLTPHTASSEEIFGQITRECEGVPVRAHNLMYYSKGKKAPECRGAFTLFPDDFVTYVGGVNSQADRYTADDNCFKNTPPTPPNAFDIPMEERLTWEKGPHWWLYGATRTVTYCTKGCHHWLCCDMDNHRVFFYRNRK
jgi:hypothetical protein